MIRRLLALVLLAPGFAAIAVIGLAAPAAACSCVAVTDDEAFARADAVFAGELREVLTPEGDSHSSADPERLVFEVQRVFKGEALRRQVVVTARDSASCGLELSGSGAFLVFAFSEGGELADNADGALFSNLCSGTRAGGSVPAAFGSGAEPTPILRFETESSGLSPSLIVGSLLVVAVATGLVVVRRARAPRPVSG